MGKLFDVKYWNMACTQMDMARRDADHGKIRDLGCQYFTELVEDKAFENDVNILQNFSSTSWQHYSKKFTNRDFFDKLMESEIEMMKDRKIDTDIACDIVGKARELRAKFNNPNTWDQRLLDRVVLLQQLICKNAPSEDNKQIANRAETGVKGFLLASVNVAAGGGAGAIELATAGMLGGTALGAGMMIVSGSVGSGRTFINNAIKGRW